MLIKTPKRHSLLESDVTAESVFLNRRRLLKQMGFVGMGGLLASSAQAGLFDLFNGTPASAAEDIPARPLRALSFQADKQQQSVTAEVKATTYNNFYEFGLGKNDPAQAAKAFQTNSWQLQVSGMVNTPLTLDYDDLFAFPLEERIYRLRCVEAWSMVIPWIGFPLASLLQRADPTSDAKYVAFETLYDPKQMPGQSNRYLGGGIRYPYVEGLRIDEAMHPLTLLAVGVYGKNLPPQNGAPIRLVVPWKYGFKSIKSIVGIKLVNKEPPTTWNLAAPKEYGFYANVNPQVDHPRWSQASERRIMSGGLGSEQRIQTLPFNGYAEDVAQLYTGMNLRRNY